MEYQMIDEIKVETNITKFLTLKTMFFLAGFFVFGLVLSSNFHESVQFPFMVFNLLVAFVLCINSPFNKGKKLYQSIIIFLFSLKESQTSYHAIDIEYDEDDLINGISFMYKQI